MSVESRLFGYNKENKPVMLYTVSNNHGMKAVISSLGAVVTSLIVPDRNGNPVDVVLGYEKVEAYYEDKGSLGATVGRHANRIAGAQFELNGTVYKLAENDGRNNLHSNPGSYYVRMWDAEAVGDNSVRMTLFSPDGDQGYPGNLNVSVTFTVTENNILNITYAQKSDADTVVNMTNHSYFNLSGHDSGDVLSQKVVINADYTTPSDKELIPTGEIRSVENTPFDFRSRKTIGRDINCDDEQLRNGGGYDHNFVLNNGGSFGFAAEMESDVTGIAMEVYTDMPGMQLYTANTTELDGGKGGCSYGHNCGACFETQFYPDSVHHDNFPSCILKAGKEFRTVTEYRFYNI